MIFLCQWLSASSEGASQYLTIIDEVKASYMKLRIFTHTAIVLDVISPVLATITQLCIYCDLDLKLNSGVCWEMLTLTNVVFRLTIKLLLIQILLPS